MQPTPGKQYTIQDENTLSLVAQRAYGDATYWIRIWNANQTILRSGDPNLIFPGETVLIPLLPERQLPPSPAGNQDHNGIFLNLDGRIIRPMTARLIRSMDLVANGFQVTIPWEPGVDTDLDSLVAPYSYTPAIASIGSTPIVTGILYGTEPVISQGTVLNLSGATATADLVDSTWKPPYEINNTTLKDLLLERVKPLGFNVIFEADTGGEFDRITATKGQSLFSVFTGMAQQRSVLLSCNTGTDLVVLRADVDGAPVATLEEGVTLGVTGWGSSFDGRQRFNVYRATSQSPLGNSEGLATDQKVPRTRFKDIAANESQSGNLKAAAEWARNKTLADALSFTLTVEGWYKDNGEPWVENEIVTVISKSMFLPQGFDFLINRVEYVLGPNGRSSVLSFVPPTVYTQGEIVEPW
jgi:prophage tail gpP-like protein